MLTEFYEQYAYLDDEPFQRPLNADYMMSLKEFCKQRVLEDTDELFIFEVGADQWYGVIASHLVYHEVAQGITDGQAWVVCFCPVCNAGSSFVPIVEGNHLTFAAQGIHHSMVLMADDQTKSYWDHLSGMCLTGDYTGKQLQRIGSVQSTTVKNALAMHPDIRIFFSRIAEDEKEDFDHMQNLRADDQWGNDWRVSLFNPAKEDTRLPRLTMGLGVWTDDDSKFYSYVKLNANNNVIFDTFDGRNMLVYLDPVAHVPTAIYTDANSANWRGKTLHLSTGDYVQNSVVYNQSQQRKKVELPRQLFIRWYAFAFKYPKTNIY